MKSLLIATFFLFASLAKGQTLVVNYAQFQWTDIAPDSVIPLIMQGIGSTNFNDTLRIDLTNDSQPDFFLSTTSQGGMGGHYDATKVQGLNSAVIAEGQQASSTVELTHNFKDGDTTFSFTSGDLFLHYNSWYAGPATQYTLFSPDTMIHVCVRIANTFYFVEMFRHPSGSLLYINGFYSVTPVGLTDAKENMDSFFFSNNHFYFIFREQTTASFSIMDMTGRTVQESGKKQYSSGETAEMKLPPASGIYIMNMLGENQRKSIKFVIQ